MGSAFGGGSAGSIFAQQVLPISSRMTKYAAIVFFICTLV